MGIQDVLAGERVWTQVTFKGAILAVSLKMRLQKTLLVESFAAVFAIVLLFRFVHFQMDFVGILHGERCWTVRTQKLSNLSVRIFVLR